MDKVGLSQLPDMRLQLGVPLSDTQLQSYNKVALRLMRNSIFAQYGYPFTVKWIADYFGTRSWYHAGGFKPEAVSAVDTENVRLIRQFEDRLSPHSLNKLPDIRATLGNPIDESALKTMSKRELKILRNSIFVQYGREFKTLWLQKYYETRPWYKRGSYNESMLTPVDRSNVALVLRYENAGDVVVDQAVLKIGYCERDSSLALERYVFKPGHVLKYTIESQNPYASNGATEVTGGQWRAGAGGVEYRLAGSDEWEMLEIESSTHFCR